MLYSLLLIFALVVIFRFYKNQSKNLSSEQKKKVLRKWLIISVAIAVAVLAFSKGNVIAGSIASLVALFSRALPLLRFLPMLRLFFNKKSRTGQSQQSKTPVAQVNMDKAQAADILGVDVDANEEDIIIAHKRLIQKMHPDKGGSEALARQINEAKQILLGR